MGWGVGIAAGLQVAGGVANGIGNLAAGKANAQAAAMEAAGAAADYRTQGATIAANNRLEAINYDAQADYYLRAAGRAQSQGRQEREMRGVQLGQDKGAIVAQAAGSGIDVSSGEVGKALRDTVRSAYHDMEVSALNEYEAAYGAMKNRAIAKTNAANRRSIADWAEKAYSSLASQAERAGAIGARSTLRAGYSSAFSSVLGGVAGAAGTMALSRGSQAVVAPSAGAGEYTLNTVPMGGYSHAATAGSGMMA